MDVNTPRVETSCVNSNLHTHEHILYPLILCKANFHESCRNRKRDV